MIARFRSWWQKAKKPLEIIIITVVCLLVIAMLVVVALTYILNWNVPGLRGKNLWDWLQLLIIPAVLAVGGYLFNYTTTRADQRNTQLRDQTEQAIASDNQREAALQAYIDSMSELLLHEKLRESGENDEVRTIARVRTLTALPRLDGQRKRSVVQFLYESGLIEKDKKIIDLRGAILGGATLAGATLAGAALSGANLLEADLRGTDMREADLTGAFLREANLSVADLTGAYLNRANMGRAILRGAELRGTDMREASLTGAYLNRANMREADLSGADLSLADLREANLREANLHGADLFGANLSGAILTGASLIEADLREAEVTDEQLAEAKSLKGAIMPDGTKHD